MAFVGVLMEYLEILKRYSRFFGFDKKYFELLKAMSFERLNTANNNSVILTPLLEEICKYALVLAEFNEIEMHTIRGVYNNDEAFNSLLEVVDNSFYYISDAIDDECCHPTILTFDSLLNGADIYDVMIETVYNNPLAFTPEKLTSMFEVDKSITNTEDEILESFVEDMAISNNNIYALGRILKKAAVDRARNKMLMDKYIKSINNKSITDTFKIFKKRLSVSNSGKI